ncbi:MAG: hypothetical protein K0S34_2337 [Bacillales bacterium]|jgi:uncharacterized cofD-like protein|nr:hypothetical protein [Bacillales bacterium]
MTNQRNPKIVVIGGGTGLSVLLRGIKKYPADITAIVTVADDGGSSGMLRKGLNIPAPGDIRNVLVALSDVEPLVEELFQHRFSSGDGLAGHSLGNLLIAGMTSITGDFFHAIREMSKVLNVRGKVLPAVNRGVTLHAQMDDGTIVSGESVIPKSGKKISRVYITPEDVSPINETIREIKEADIIVIGPGSLYTSILPNLLVSKINNTITESKAKVVYICNVMTQNGETLGYTAGDHLEAIYKHIPSLRIDTIIVNSEEIPDYLIKKYALEESEPVKIDYDKLLNLGVEVIGSHFVSYQDGVIRHNTKRLSKVIISLLKQRVNQES